MDSLVLMGVERALAGGAALDRSRWGCKVGSPTRRPWVLVSSLDGEGRRYAGQRNCHLPAHRDGHCAAAETQIKFWARGVKRCWGGNPHLLFLLSLEDKTSVCRMKEDLKEVGMRNKKTPVPGTDFYASVAPFSPKAHERVSALRHSWFQGALGMAGAEPGPGMASDGCPRDSHRPLQPPPPKGGGTRL